MLPDGVGVVWNYSDGAYVKLWIQITFSVIFQIILDYST